MEYIKHEYCQIHMTYCKYVSGGSYASPYLLIKVFPMLFKAAFI